MCTDLAVENNVISELGILVFRQHYNLTVIWALLLYDFSAAKTRTHLIQNLNKSNIK